MFIWERPEWPKFFWDEARLTSLLATVARKQGWLLGRMDALGFDLRNEAHLQTLTEDIVKSSEIEGESLSIDQVRSSIARHLGLDVGGLIPSDRSVDGVVEMMLDATRNHAEPLTKHRLFNWHAALFPTGRSGMTAIRVGNWRDDAHGPMQVVSGPIGREKIHYQAPPAPRVPIEMTRFLDWFQSPGETDPLLVAGVAHLWFVTIHPFEDGNGRIARAIADMALARAEGTGQRFYSMSAQIRREHKVYYDTLERTQKGGLDATDWLLWFLDCLLRAIEQAENTLSSVLQKGRFWERFACESLNERQIKILNMLLNGFEGKLTTSKWAKIAKCSQDSAWRDIKDLIERGMLKKNPEGGRSTSYSLNA